jgi:muramoyltetrapeptide carboxypeptidase
VSDTATTWIKPRRLRPGDRVSLVAPASPFKPEELEPAVAEIRRLGFDAVYDERVLTSNRFVAGSAAMRASVLHDAWNDPSIAALIAIRGGYGSAQLLPLLDPALMRKAGKILVGYSDITALLCFHLQHHVVCFHGPMVERRLSAGESAYDRSSFLRTLTATDPPGEMSPAGLDVLRKGEAAGTIVGGTITQLVASLGTPWAFVPPPGCILFLEDVGERPYRVDRMLTQLRQAGIVDRAAALVFGELPSCDEPGGEHPVRDVLADFVHDFAGPVLFGFPSGHTAGPSWTVPLGVCARVRTSPPALVIEEGAVS